MKPDAMSHRVTVQKWYGLGQDWHSLSMALIATGEAADKAVNVSSQQRARYRAHANRFVRCSELRNEQVNACLWHFRYVTAVSNRAWALKQQHESELSFWRNLQGHHERALGPQAHMVRSHQTYLDSLRREIENVKRIQSLKIICIRWGHLRAATDLTQQARKFHLTCARLDFWKKRTVNAFRRAYHFQKESNRCIEEYEHLEKGFFEAHRAIQALRSTNRSDGKDAAVSASTQDGTAEQMVQGVEEHKPDNNVESI